MTPWRVIEQIQDGVSGYAIVTDSGIFWCGKDEASVRKIVEAHETSVSGKNQIIERLQQTCRGYESRIKRFQTLSRKRQLSTPSEIRRGEQHERTGDAKCSTRDIMPLTSTADAKLADADTTEGNRENSNAAPTFQPESAASGERGRKFAEDEADYIDKKLAASGELLPCPTWTVYFCPACGRSTDSSVQLRDKHYCHGKMCAGKPVTLTYRLNAAPAPDVEAVARACVDEIASRITHTMSKYSQDEMLRIILETLRNVLSDNQTEEGKRYYELLYAVERKHPGETRHETALRYIRQAETHDASRVGSVAAIQSEQADKSDAGRPVEGRLNK